MFYYHILLNMQKLRVRNFKQFFQDYTDKTWENQDLNKDACLNQELEGTSLPGKFQFNILEHETC